MGSQPPHLKDAIAIVGTACRFAGGANSPSALWHLLKHPRDVLSEIPHTRFDAAKFYHPDALHGGTSNVRHSYLLGEDHRAFDAQFFGVKPVEAAAIDPQQRILLETSYEALEAAGMPLERIQGSGMGVYVGLMTEEYSKIIGADMQDIPTYFGSGTARNNISNRISYSFDLHGPSMTIDTACSSSLVALHQAVLSLRAGETDCALVAGANLILTPDQFIVSSKLKMLSPSGRSRMWDAKADGYGRGDGFGVLVVKTLSKALADGDSIECIVRETGVNQDGRTMGITMPNATAQQDLIRNTYKRAGLDLNKASDRPQFFEAHGTGTPAGDPIEAEAISSVFFSDGETQQQKSLQVGSVKTILGHTEGTAGILGILKASLAMQHGMVPPNMLLDDLNPRVQPFYTHLQIPQTAQDWPKVPPQSPRRVSVNSFGFGGTNAHAILESFATHPTTTYDTQTDLKDDSNMVITPFNFSATSEYSLHATLAAYASYLRKNPDLSLWDLSWTLNARRSRLRVRQSISAQNIDQLVEKLEDASNINYKGSVADVLATTKPHTAEPRLLGIFTGQGAQWATMGRRLLDASPLAAECFQKLQMALDTLPQHAPTWSLQEELSRDAATSRIREGPISQPLCTAIQIMLVQLVSAAKVSFSAVVGHSSGEIAAAYAAGYISAEDAIRVAYFRGLFLEKTREGAMLAVGTTPEDARHLCSLPSLRGRICVAAVNSPTSVTLSGDPDAIQDALEIFEDEKKFARRLRVDKAYHSHHMAPIAETYTQALRDCKIQLQPRPADVHTPTWISSVTGQYIENLDLYQLQDSYWGDNMKEAVLFSAAVERAVGAHGPFDAILEVGPHPALKSPASDTILASAERELPYIATLSRGKNDTEAFASALGSLWTRGFVTTFDSFGHRAPNLVKNLPTYSWNHDRTYWHDTRRARALRENKTGNVLHPLLGRRCDDEAEGELRFRNHLHMRDILWLADHRIQGQVVLPGSAYLCACLEAVMAAFPVSPQEVRLVEMRNVVIRKALVLPEGEGGTELLVCVRLLEQKEDHIRASFGFSSSSDAAKEGTALSENCSGEILVYRKPAVEENHEEHQDGLPSPRQTLLDGMSLSLQPSNFYDWARDLGYGYEGYFRGLSEIWRKMNAATGRIQVPKQGNFILHPAVLDAAIQTVLVAYSCPGDGRIRSLHVPTRLDLLRIDPAACQVATGEELSFVSSAAPSIDVVGDVELHTQGRTLVQMQGLHATPINPPTASNDAKIFFEMTLRPEMLRITQPAFDPNNCDAEHILGIDAERVACFYLRSLSEQFPAGMRHHLQWEHSRLLEYADSCVTSVKEGTHSHAQPAWITDTDEEINKILHRYSSDVNFSIMKAAYEGLSRSIRDEGRTSMWDVLTSDGMLDDYYRHAQGMPQYVGAMADIVAQLSNRFARMDILQVGAGTGVATASILEKVQGAFRTFTFTDISSRYFPDASTKFAEFESQIKFQPLDIEKPVADQGFVEGSYDVVIASLALHATGDLTLSLANTRSLLRPGGFLVILEPTMEGDARFPLIFGGLPGWWPDNPADGRRLSPCVSVDTWEHLMQKTGFSRIDAVVPAAQEIPISFSVLVSQAVDERVQFLRNALSPDSHALGLENLTIIGGEGSSSANVQKLVSRHYQRVRCVSSLADLAVQELPVGSTVVSLLDAEINIASIFENISETDLKAIQKMFRLSKIILWVSKGSLIDHPHRNMFRGLARSAKLEMGNVRVQNLDFDTDDVVEGQVVARSLMQLEAYSGWDDKGRTSDLLWNCEPELFVRGGVVLVPRLQQSKERNDRYNSTRRFISRDVCAENTSLLIRKGHGVATLEENHPSSSPIGGKIRLIYSLLKAVPVGPCRGFLSVGEHTETHRKLLVFSESLASYVNTPSSWTLPLTLGPSEDCKGLLLLQAQLLAHAIMASTTTTRHLVVLNPDDVLADALIQLTNKERVQLTLMTSKNTGYKHGWTVVHPRETRAAIQQMLPCQAFTFIDMSEPSNTMNSVAHYLPTRCKKINRMDLLVEDAELDLSSSGIRSTTDLLQAAYLLCATTSQESVDLSLTPTIDLSALAQVAQRDGDGKDPKNHRQAIVSWSSGDHVSLQVQPASHQMAFRPDRTYWLVGLTRGLGPGLCEFMAARGAAFIALSSRRPQVNSDWISSMASRGCTIRTFANDITSRDSLRALHKKIVSSMPPIAGVAQGAMVLRDAVLPDLSYSQLRETLAPKVDGSLHLDELFSENDLEFFVFFSSMAYIAGNRGQSAYGAANAFMTSLAARRRKRGLAGSVMNMGGIVGEGYITRQLELGKQSALIKQGFDFLSEQAFHELFSEAVLAGRPGSYDSLEISAGLRVGESEGVSFANNPIFQHQMAKAGVTSSTGSIGSGPNVMIKTRLLEANADEEVFDIIRDGLLAKMEMALQIKLDKSSAMHLTPDQLGIDSLVAVEIQSWFTKELGVDLSVMRILNAVSIQDLVNAARAALVPKQVSEINHFLSDKEIEASKSSQTYANTADVSVAKSEPNITIETEHSVGSSNASTASSLPDAVSDVSSSTYTDEASETSVISTSPNFGSSSISSDWRFERSVPMSFAQSRFWFLKFAVENQAAFNVTTVVHLRGFLDAERLAQAALAVGQRHEAIRTAFYADDVAKRPMQGILPWSNLKLEHETIAKDEEAEKAIQEIRYHAFDLPAGQSTRLKLLSLDRDRHILVLGYDHIAVDGIGNQVFFSDLENAYNGTLDVRGSHMLQYPDFTLKQHREFKQGVWEEHLDYWRDQFSNVPPPFPVLDLSRKLARPATTKYASTSVKIHLNASLKERIRDCSHRWRVSSFHFYLAVFRVLLFRHTHFQSDDLCVGVADGNRKDPDILRSLGLFLNLLPLRFYQSKDQTFADTLQDVKRVSDDAFTHSHVPFDVLLSELNIPRSQSHTPLFQTFFNYQQNISDSRKFCGCEATGELVSGGETGYDISLDIVDSKSRENSLTLSVNSDLYTAEHARILQRSYLCLLEEFVADSTAPLSRPPLHQLEDISNAVMVGRGPEQSDSQWPPTVCHRIDNIVDMFPDKCALTNGAGYGLTYQEMVRRANEVAAELKLLNIGRSSIVGLFQSPGPDWVCSFLGILRAGATCVPLDSGLGMGRLLLICQDCKPSAILVDVKTSSETDFLKNTAASIIPVSTISSGEDTNKSQMNEACPTESAIIVYTSGSTGVPKGSVIQHDSYKNFCEFGPPRWGVDLGTETVLQQSSYAFDLSIGQILTCLCYGGTLLVPVDERRRDPAAICDLMIQNSVTFTIATPTEYSAWLRHDNSRLLSNSQWRTAITAGETVTKSLVQAFSSLGNEELRLINVYGPSETTIGTADQPLLPAPDHLNSNDISSALSILPNYSVYIADADGNPVPSGVPGHIVIAGAGVAKGYLNRDGETASAFVCDDEASKLFKDRGWLLAHVTEDRGRLDSQGRLVLHGRMGGSTQIKMGGVRMDLQDIESTIIAMSPCIHQAVVSRRVSPKSEAEFLAAFVVMNDDASATERPQHDDSFLAQLMQQLPLPQNMRPAIAVAVDTLPTTISNKIDRLAVDKLALDELVDPISGDVASSSDLDEFEDSLRLLWEESLPTDLLRVRSIRDRNADFFVAGGNSLSLLTLQSLIRERLNISVSIMSLFGASTLGQMASALQNESTVSSTAPPEIVDWERETALPTNFVSQKQSDAAEECSSRGTESLAVVVLTGATGFLGQRILRELLADDRISKVHCLALRRSSKELPEIFSDAKVAVHRGDLRSRQLGLSDDAAATIFAEASVVVHCGANVSFLESYHTLRHTNLASTQELARLSLPRRIPFHYMSTASVTQLTKAAAWGPTSVSAFPPISGQLNGFGYKSSKWASETFLERVSQTLGLPVVIHRPSSITGDGAQDTDLMGNIMRFSERAKAVPDAANWRGRLDFVDVDTVARRVVQEVAGSMPNTQEKTPNGSGNRTRYVYENGDLTIGVDELGNHVERQIGEVPAVMPFKNWVDALAEAGMNQFLVEYLRKVNDKDGIILFPKLYE